MSNHYETLGVDRTDSPEQIKAAYRKLASKHHPDREGGDTATFQRIQKAYDVLSDPEKRAKYDAHGDEPSEGEMLDRIINEVLMQILDSGRCDTKHHNIVDSLRNHFHHAQNNITSQVRQLRQNSRNYRRVHKRMKANNPIIFESLRQKRLQNIHVIRDLLQQHRTGVKILERLQDYSYQYDQYSVPQYHHWGTSTATNF